MARPALAQETLCALRHEIARIEGVLPQRLVAPPPRSGKMIADGRDQTPANPALDAVLMRRSGRGLPEGDLLSTGVEPLDALLGGGLPLGALTEIHAPTARATGAAAAFTLALATLLLKRQTEQLPLLWLGTTEAFAEAGLPYAAGIRENFGIPPHRLLFAEAPRLADTLWIAEEAARLPDLAAVILELRGNPRMLDLTATRRLHRRARAAGRPVLLLRQSAEPTPTAAPVRLRILPAPAAPRQTLLGPLEGSLGPPGLQVAVTKSRTARPDTFTLEWNPHERCLQLRTANHTSAQTPPAVSGAVVSTPVYRPHLAQAPGQVVDFAHGEWRRAAGG